MPARQDVVIIGAPRSGTNMLRDVITQLDGLETWPCDEINYIWRHGNVAHPTDEFGPELATPAVSRFIRKAFDRIATSTGAERVVEKTCANSLRVGFVERVLDQPIYLFIVRDGMDAVASARSRWTADMDYRYLAKKVRYVPPRDLPIYAGRYAKARVARLTSEEKALPTWGPVYQGMDQLVAAGDLTTVCAMQWRRCVERSEDDLGEIDEDRVVRIRYEQFVSDPVGETGRIAERLGMTPEPELIRRATTTVRSDSVGKGRASLGEDESTKVSDLVGATLERHGYDR